MLQPTGQSTSRLLYQGNREFKPAVAADIRLVFTIGNGSAAGVIRTSGERIPEVGE